MQLIDQYAYFNRLNTTHPVEKMTLSLLFLIFTLLVRNEVISIIIFFMMSVMVIAIAKIPWSFYLKLLLLPIFFLGTSLLTIILSFAPIDAKTPASYVHFVFLHWQFFIGKDSVLKAIELFFISLSSISCLYFLILTTSVQSICFILRKYKFPPLFVELCELTYRFIFIFLQSTQEIYIAQQSRLGYHTPRQQLRSVALLITSLFSNVWQRARQLNDAMAARSIESNPLFWEENFHYSRKNWLAISVLFSLVMLIYILSEVL